MSGSQAPNGLHELRIYSVAKGRLGDLQHRFRSLTLPLFERHRFSYAGPWIFETEEGERIVYLLHWASAEERDERLTAFRTDPEWTEGLKASEQNGPLVNQIDVHLLTPLENWSPPDSP